MSNKNFKNQNYRNYNQYTKKEKPESVEEKEEVVETAEEMAEEITEAAKTVEEVEEVEEVTEAVETVEEVEGKILEAAPLYGVVNCARLNIRRGPSVNTKPICIVEIGSELEIEPFNDIWFKAKTKDGVSGYCMKEFIDEK